MAETIFEVGEWKKKFTGFQEIPKGNEKVAYVFFQSNNNSKFLVTTEKRKIMAAELRMGKYDRIMTIYRGEFDHVIRKNVACEEDGHSFDLVLTFHYYIKNPEHIYLKQINQVGVELEKALFRMEFDLGRKFGFREGIRLEEALLDQIEERFHDLSYLTIRYEIQLTPDHVAQKILEREKAHEIAEHDSDLSTIEDKNKLENEYDLEQMRLEREKELAVLAAELNRLKVEGVGALFERFGANAGNLIDLANGDLTGAQMSEILNRNKKENLEALIELRNSGIMVDHVIESMIPSLMLDGKGASGGGSEYLKLGESYHGPETGTGKEGALENGFQWNDSDKEDGTVE